MHSEYYEAIIQVRPADQEVLNFIYSKVYDRKAVFISKEIKVKTGIDLYISDQKFARSLGIRLKKVFGGTVKSTRSLYTFNKNESKKVYRVTVCYRLDNS